MWGGSKAPGPSISGLTGTLGAVVDEHHQQNQKQQDLRERHRELRMTQRVAPSARNARNATRDTLSARASFPRAATVNATSDTTRGWTVTLGDMRVGG